jgi:hypothetical protein
MFSADGPVCVIYPNPIIPSTWRPEDPRAPGYVPPTPLDELGALSNLALFVPWSVSPAETLRGAHPTYSHAFMARMGTDRKFLRSVMQRGESLRERFEASRQPLSTINWVSLAVHVDAAAVDAVYKGRRHDGLVSFCWHCGAGGATKDLSLCSRCKRACFCSTRCQKAAWWWHKVATDEGACGPA